MTASAQHGGATRPVVPVDRRVQEEDFAIGQAGQELLDQESVIDKTGRAVEGTCGYWSARSGSLMEATPSA